MANPIYWQNFSSYTASLTAADAADYDGGGTLVSIVQGSASGPLDVRFVRISPNASTTAGNIIRFFKVNATGTVRIGTFLVPAFTLTATGASPEWVWYPPGDCKLNGTAEYFKASQEKADTIKLMAETGDYF